MGHIDIQLVNDETGYCNHDGCYEPPMVEITIQNWNDNALCLCEQHYSETLTDFAAQVQQIVAVLTASRL